MLINQPVSRETWRKLVASVKDAVKAGYVPEYSDAEDRGQNKRYYR